MSRSMTTRMISTLAMATALIPQFASARPDMAAAEQRARRAMAQQPMTPVPPPPGTRIDRDIAYGADPAQRLDVYRPAQGKGAPILLMVHGGGWANGDKAATRVVDNKVAHWIPRGLILVSVNYRLVPAATPLGQADDVAKALAYVQAHAGEWGGDARRVVLVGHSAGAHLVSLLTAAPDIASGQGAKAWLGTIALDSAGYDIVALMRAPHFPLYDKVFATDEALWRAASPTLRLDKKPVPMLLVCSSKRADSCPAAKGFAAKAQSLGGKATVLPLPMSHGDINGLLGMDGAYTAATDKFLSSLGLEASE